MDQIALGGMEKDKELKELDTAAFARAPSEAMEATIAVAKQRYGGLRGYYGQHRVQSGNATQTCWKSWHLQDNDAAIEARFIFRPDYGCICRFPLYIFKGFRSSLRHLRSANSDHNSDLRNSDSSNAYFPECTHLGLGFDCSAHAMFYQNAARHSHQTSLRCYPSCYYT